MPASKIKILIVDDSVLVQSKLTSIVENISSIHSVGTTGNAHEALRMVVEHSPDIVLLDIQLLGGSGIDVLKSIKQSHPSTIVIMITNFGSSQYRKRCKKEGAEYFLDKTIDMHLLEGILKEISNGQAFNSEFAYVRT